MFKTVDMSHDLRQVFVQKGLMELFLELMF